MTAAVIEQPATAISPARQRIRSPLTLRELLTPAFHHRQLAMLAFLLPLALAVLAAVLAQPVYTAESRLLILLGDDYVFRSDVSGAAPGLSFDRAQIVQAEMEILSARDLHADAIQAVGLRRVYPALADAPHGLEVATERFDKDLTIQNVPQSNVVDLTLRNRSAVVAAEVLNKLIDLYIERRREIFQQASPGKIDAERDQLKQRLAAIDAQIAQFAADRGFGDYDQALAAAQNQQSALTSEVESLDQQYATRSGRAAQLGGKIRRAPQSIELFSDRARSQQLDALTANLLALQAQRRDAVAKFADGYPLVADLDQRIAALQAQISAAPAQQLAGVRMGPNPTHQQLDAELADSQGDMAGLRLGRVEAARALQAANARLRELIDIGPQYRDLVRNRALIEASFSDLAKRAEDTRLQDTLSRSQANVRVIQRAASPVRGKTGRFLLLGAGVALGCFTAASAVLFASAFSEEMITPRDVEQKLDVPIILSIPWRGEARGPRPGGAGGLRGALLGADDSALLIRLAASLSPKAGPAIQFIAPDDGAGVSSLALDLALQAASQGARRVFLIDVEPREGHSACVRLQAAGARMTREANQRFVQVEGMSLHVSLPIGTRDLRIDENQWEGVLAKARKAYDVVIIDSPAVSRSAAGVVIAPFVDLTLMVVEAERTRAAVARNLIDRIDAAGGLVVGAILNKRRFPIPPFIYSRL
jgi:succinoglycan biosynthesis transport protein ExoP